MLIYPVDLNTFLDRHRRFSNTNNVRSQAEVMMFQEGDILNLWFHDIDKVYTTSMKNNVTTSDAVRIYMSNFPQRVPVSGRPMLPFDNVILVKENKLLQ